jgi:hypothetical protein
MVYIGKLTFNIDSTIIHLGLNLPWNYKHFQSLLA